CSGNAALSSQEWEDAQECTQDHTLQYFSLMLAKVALNCFMMSFTPRSLYRSFMGICTLSLCVTDFLLVCGIGACMLLARHISPPVSLCFLLTHASVVYSLLPVPFLMLGVLDYSTHSHVKSPPSKRVFYVAEVILVWGVAGVYSCLFTNTSVLKIVFNINTKALVCIVEVSHVVTCSCLIAFSAICFLLTIYYKDIVRWTRQANRLSSAREIPQAELHSDLSLSYFKLQEQGREQPITDGSSSPKPPLFIAFTLCFALHWGPYLLMIMVTEILDMAIPAYTTVNSLWMVCANSFMVGMMFWLKSDKLGPGGFLNICFFKCCIIIIMFYTMA
uniref:G-protein coupled receptors family 1 profile domain-containing protein n=1 Tax=Denticeps clupeoides TaxID=299321 RepID=A0AAY4BAY0_9TELE